MNQDESKAVAQMAAVCAEMASLSWSTQEQMDIARKASAALRGWLAVKELGTAPKDLGTAPKGASLAPGWTLPTVTLGGPL